jgi:hypothetical protein
MEFLTENNEILTSEIVTKEVFQKVFQLKKSFNNVSDMTSELIRHPAKTIKSFVGSIGGHRSKRWVDRVSEREVGTQNIQQMI